VTTISTSVPPGERVLDHLTEMFGGGPGVADLFIREIAGRGFVVVPTAMAEDAFRRAHEHHLSALVPMYPASMSRCQEDSCRFWATRPAPMRFVLTDDDAPAGAGESVEAFRG
jgi:hypothetical protein